MGANFAPPRHDQRNHVHTIKRLLQRAYAATEAVLWVIVTLAAVGAALVILRAPELRARAESQLAAEIAEENRQFCLRRGLTVQSHEFVLCTLDLNAIREKQQRRINEMSELF